MSMDTYSKPHISMILTCDEDVRQVLIAGFYGIPYTGQREESWRLLNELKPKDDKAWLYVCDFTEIFHQNEKEGAAVRPYHQMESFREAFDGCGLSDLGFQGNKYTWSNNQEDSLFTMGRLNRAFANLKLSLTYETSCVIYLACTDLISFSHFSKNEPKSKLQCSK